MRPGPNAPIVALDIDGTLGDYHGHFTRFAEQWTGRNLPDPEENTSGIPFHKHLGISKATYRQCKLAYRQGGMKRSMPVYPGASDLTKYIRSCGVQVWICTTRPYLRLDNIDPDTRHWLRRGEGPGKSIQYDAVLFGEHKYRDLWSIAGNRVLFVVDDLPPMLVQAKDAGDYYTVLRDQPYNRHWFGIPDRHTVAYGMMDIARVFDLNLEKRGMDISKFKSPFTTPARITGDEIVTGPIRIPGATTLNDYLSRKAT